ncbi:glycosyltransferase [Novosphingobium olei]|uniref:glycosyltransferase n=1 Tax=Novosphingobium olei TaxID=2728851 RepID=UPI00308FD033|nr:hypothetical protein NSDW_00940 [Novosphingobium olei]
MPYNGAVLIPSPDRPVAPAMTCALECAHASREFLNLEIVDPQAPHRPENARFWFIAAISFRQLSDMLKSVKHLIGPDAIVTGFVFDSYFSGRLEGLPDIIKRKTRFVSNLRRFNRIYCPFQALIAQQAASYGLNMAYLPIGVDAIRFGACANMAARYITINGYGRQPSALTAVLSDSLNRAGDSFFHYTGHVQIRQVSDPVRHRDHFWQMLRHTRVALAYSPESCDPDQRFPCSFVGQRWFESLAAGCIVAGRRPQAAETDELLNWPDATIELPDDPTEALAALRNLLGDVDRLDAISRRNYSECLRQHDWRWRAACIARDFPESFADLAPRVDALDAAVQATIAGIA